MNTDMNMNQIKEKITYLALGALAGIALAYAYFKWIKKT
jgi:hypothetical protein